MGIHAWDGSDEILNVDINREQQLVGWGVVSVLFAWLLCHCVVSWEQTGALISGCSCGENNCGCQNF